MSKCKVPPDGWYCTRQCGHSGPCAAYPEGFDETNIEDYLLTGLGTFNTKDCTSSEELCKLLKPNSKGEKNETTGN